MMIVHHQEKSASLGKQEYIKNLFNFLGPSKKIHWGYTGKKGDCMSVN